MTRIQATTLAEEPMRRLITVLRRGLYWGLPPLILYLIFQRVDLVRLQQLAASANPVLMIAGIAMLLPVVALGALRWYVLVRHYNFALLSIASSVSEYWKSLAVGMVVPGSLGSDAYRVMVLGRQKGYYLRSAFVVGVEKLAALFSCAVLIAVLYPLLTPNHLPSVVAQLVDGLYLFFLAGIMLALAFTVLREQSWIQRLAELINNRLTALARRVARQAATPPSQEEGTPRAALALMLTVFSPAVALPAIGLSLAIYLVTSAQSQVLFQAFAYEIPFSVNLFITPLLFLLYALPISFGGIGIREGAFILAYSAFGVPPEISLIVSFCGLLGNLLSYAIGAGLFFLGKNRHRVG